LRRFEEFEMNRTRREHVDAELVVRCLCMGRRGLGDLAQRTFSGLIASIITENLVLPGWDILYR
jgi:hypothetical protein